MRVHKKVLSLPAVDAVEACRCADCKHWERYVHDRGDDSRCGFHNRQIGRDGYCAWGQRREDGLYESLKRGLEEAIAFENGEIECRTETREDGDA